MSLWIARTRTPSLHSGKKSKKCPDDVSCYLMLGNDDYLVQVQTRDMEDCERIHKQDLSRNAGPRMVAFQFAMLNVVKRSISPAALSGLITVPGFSSGTLHDASRHHRVCEIQNP